MSTGAQTAAVDVIVPFRDQGPWLEQTGHSLQRQTCPHWRALLVNDGSGPEALAAAAQLCQSDQRFQLLHRSGPKPAPGPWQARNLGIAAASAPLVAFLDADDLWHPEKLARQLTLHQKVDGVLSVCSYHRFQSASLALVETRHPPSRLQLAQLLHGNAIPLSTVIIDRTLLLESGGFRPEHHEDYGLWLRLFAAAAPPRYSCLQEPLMAYRLHPQSLSAARYRSLLAVNQLFHQHLTQRRQRWPALLRWGLKRSWQHLSQDRGGGNRNAGPVLLPEPFFSLISPQLKRESFARAPHTSRDDGDTSAP